MANSHTLFQIMLSMHDLVVEWTYATQPCVTRSGKITGRRYLWTPDPSSQPPLTTPDFIKTVLIPAIAERTGRKYAYVTVEREFHRSYGRGRLESLRKKLPPAPTPTPSPTASVRMTYDSSTDLYRMVRITGVEGAGESAMFAFIPTTHN